MFGIQLRKPEVTGTNAGLPQDYSNPFSHRSVERVSLRIQNNAVAFSDCPSLAVGVDFSATVYFKNGNSKGEQSIKAETFEGLVAKVNAFIAGLP